MPRHFPHLALATLAFLAGSVPAPSQQPPPDVRSGEVLVPRTSEEPETFGGGGRLFTDVAGPAGMTTLVSSTWGAAWGDADGDGLLDLFLNRHAQQIPTLFLNQGGTFLPVSDRVTDHKQDRHAPAWGDYDNDGDEDLFLTTGAGNPNHDFIPAELYRSEGGTAYTEIAGEAGVDQPACRGRGAAWLDYDGDGDLDLLYLCSVSNVGARTALYENRGAAGFVDVAAEVGLQTNLRWNGGIFPADYDDDGDLDLFITAATVPAEDLSVLYRNDGGQYTDVTDEVGIGPLLGGRGAAWGDFDNDGDVDLYVGRGANFRGNGDDGWTWSPDAPDRVGYYYQVKNAADPSDVLILRTDSPTLTFDFPTVPIFLERPPVTEIYLGAGMNHPAAIPFTVGDGHFPSVDGKPDFDPLARRGVYIWRESGGKWVVTTTSGGGFYHSSALVTGTTPFLSVDDEALEAPDEDRTNRLFRNNGDGTFTDVTAEAGVGDPNNTGPVIAGDFDNDGDLDIFGLNGDHIRPQPSPWLAYRNDGGLRFKNVSRFLHFPIQALSRKATAVVADYDNDGDLDVWVSNEIGPAPYLYGPYFLFRNRGTSNHGLTVRLQGTRSNRDGIGSRVWVHSGGRVQFRDATNGSALYSQNDPRPHFGLGTETEADILVRWPDGSLQAVRDVAADRVVTIVQQ